ncbi:hypothetical protein [Amycolatopsis sp. GM8]|uniref:hypothetical protein n=1 Tax=Amycolatopsis sp. GM8 TaxID=2896530 RepID=UPI001F318890|nr:hypothetical protein [Amycolatopsis sp. GM8]
MNTPGFPADEPGPRIEDADHGAALLPDSQLGAPWWAPAPEAVPAAEGTFRFLFRVTGHDDDGSPAIAATVTTVLRFPPPDPPDARPVERTSLAVRLRIPFVDAETGAPTATELPAEATERDGLVHCRAEIRGAVARAAYGALSAPGFQPGDGAGLVVETSFTAVRQTAVAWAGDVLEGVEIDHDALDLAVLVPARGWPWEEPPREEHPVPEEHPEWGEVSTSQITLPDISGQIVLRSADVAEVASPVLEQEFVVPGLLDLPPDEQEHPLTFPPLHPSPPVADLGVTVSRQQRVPLLVPCRDHPELYLQDVEPGAAPEVVGCQEAFQLGRAPAQRFAPAPRLDREHRYTVWESLQQPATYLVVPAHYRVGRHPTGRPEFEWLQLFDATVDAGLPCLLQARCVPDLTVAELAELQVQLRAEEGGRDVRVLLPTSPTVGSTGVSVRSSTLSGAPRAVLDDDAVRVALRVDYEDAVVIVSQLRGGDAVAQVAFETGDPRLALATTLHLDVADLAGPYPDGPVRTTATGLRNDADTAATVTGLRTRAVLGGFGERIPLDPPVRVPAHGEAALAVPAADAVAEARLDPADPAQLVVRNVYLENLHTVVLVRRDVDLRAVGVVSAELRFAVSGIEVARAILPADTPALEVTLVQPLVADRSTFDRKVAVSVSFTGIDGGTRPAPGPAVVDLSTGAVVRLSQLVGA